MSQVYGEAMNEATLTARKGYTATGRFVHIVIRGERALCGIPVMVSGAWEATADVCPRCQKAAT